MKAANMRWWTVLLPAASIVLLDYARHKLVDGVEHAWWEEAALLVGVLLVTFSTSRLLLARLAESERREHEAVTLRQIGVELTSTLDLKAILSAVLSRSRDVLGADCLGIAMAGGSPQEMIVLSREAAEPRRMPVGSGAAFLRGVMDSGDRVEVHREPQQTEDGGCASCGRCVGIPLRMAARSLGALCIGSNRKRPAKDHELELAGHISSLASVAIANALLYQQAQQVAVLTERDRIARELHDSMAQALAYISVGASSARNQLLHRRLSDLDSTLTTMRQAADDAYLDVREAILGLRTSAPASNGLVGSLEEYLRKFSRQSGTTARLSARGAIPANLPPQVEIQLFRVIQEALTNARKHAKASDVLVKLERDGATVRVTVQDNGRGFSPADPGNRLFDGFGLDTMRERLGEIGGELAIGTHPGVGTSVVATVPLDQPSA